MNAKKMNRDMGLEPIRELVKRLTAADGCPWDRKQTPRSLSIYLVEEVFELVEAIEADDRPAIAEELGDVLFQVVFMCHLLQRAGIVDSGEAVESNVAKMKRRHPHVFGDVKLDNARQVRQQWQQIKQAEKRAGRHGSVLDGIPRGLPALLKAYRISQRAAAAGFDWDDLQGVMEKAREEWAEMEAELEQSEEGEVSAAFRDEFGDLLFTLVNVARLAGFHPQSALSDAVSKFARRFQKMEQLAREKGLCFDKLSQPDLERLWGKVKAGEENGRPED